MDYGKPFIKKKPKLRPSQLKTQESQEFRRRHDQGFQFVYMYSWEDTLKFIVKLKSNNTSKNAKVMNSLQMIKL